MWANTLPDHRVDFFASAQKIFREIFLILLKCSDNFGAEFIKLVYDNRKICADFCVGIFERGDSLKNRREKFFKKTFVQIAQNMNEIFVYITNCKT